MSNTPNTFTHAEIAREIREQNPGERVTSSLVGNVRRGDTSSARVSALIDKAFLSLTAKAKAKAKEEKRAGQAPRATRKAVAA